MSNGECLGKATRRLILEYYDGITWGSVWKRKLEDGAAFEWAVTAALICAAQKAGYRVSIPLLEEYDAADYFVLRNEIPLAHGAQVGNSDTLLRKKPLSERFFYCLVPKAIFTKDGLVYSLFREGCPYHKIMGGVAYSERPDILLMPGAPVPGYPATAENGRDIFFAYAYQGDVLSGTLSAIRSPYIPVKQRAPKGGKRMLAKGIVECSVHKTEAVALEQLARYDALFQAGAAHPRFSLVTGNDLSALPYDTHTIDVKTGDMEQLAVELETAAQLILKNAGL